MQILIDLIDTDIQKWIRDNGKYGLVFYELCFVYIYI